MAFAARLTGVGGQLTVSPKVGLTADVTFTLPTKLNTLLRETETEAPLAPALKLTGVVGMTVKSPTWTTETAR